MPIWGIIAVLKTIQFISKRVKTFRSYCHQCFHHCPLCLLCRWSPTPSSSSCVQPGRYFDQFKFFYCQQNSFLYDLGCSKKTDKNPKRCSSNTNKASNFRQNDWPFMLYLERDTAIFWSNVMCRHVLGNGVLIKRLVVNLLFVQWTLHLEFPDGIATLQNNCSIRPLLSLERLNFLWHILSSSTAIGGGWQTITFSKSSITSLVLQSLKELLAV